MTGRTVRDRVLLLAGAEIGLVAAGMAIIGWQDPVLPATSVLPPVAYALVLIALGLLPRMYVEFRRNALQLTPSDLVMIIGLFALGPWLFIATGMLAEAVAALRHRQAPLKTVFNLVHLLGGLVATATTFTVIGRTDPLDPVAWLAGAAALAACTLWDLVSTAAVLAIAEGSGFRTMVARILPTVTAGWIVSSLLGIAALVLFHETPFGPLLPIVMASGLTPDEEMAELAEFGIDQVLTKPYSVPSLLRALDEACPRAMTPQPPRGVGRPITPV